MLEIKKEKDKSINDIKRIAKISFMQKLEKHKFIFLDLCLYLLCLILIMIFRPDIGIVLSFLIMVLVITLSKRYSQFIHLGLAFLFAIMWQIVAGNEYFYGKNFFIFFGLNIFPLFAWSVGLFIAYMLFFYMYSSIEKKANFKKKLNLRAYLGFILFYWAILILAETLAFHVFGFKNLRGNAYMGLPICNCIHSPPWMQVAYLSIGPLYITTIYFLKSKTPYDVFK